MVLCFPPPFFSSLSLFVCVCVCALPLLCGLGFLFLDPCRDVNQNGPNLDLDASCLAFDATGKWLETESVSFARKQNSNRSVIHSGDNLTGAGEGDDELLWCFLKAIPAHIFSLVFVVNIYTMGVYHHHHNNKNKNNNNMIAPFSPPFNRGDLCDCVLSSTLPHAEIRTHPRRGRKTHSCTHV